MHKSLREGSGTMSTKEGEWPSAHWFVFGLKTELMDRVELLTYSTKRMEVKKEKRGFLKAFVSKSA